MPLPTNHTLTTADLTAYTPSCGASPVAAYIRVPFRCRLLKATGVLGGGITTADGTITVAANATGGVVAVLDAETRSLRIERLPLAAGDGRAR